MKIIRSFLVTVLILSLIMSINSLAAGKTTDIVMLHSGPITGIEADGVKEYLGIPFAAPPVGKLRWAPPREAESWKETRRCVKFGPACPQPLEKKEGVYNEDCLYLNVWTPAKNASGKLPVMLWIHGGGFNFGSASQPEYYGKNLAEKGVVVVTINYRLGPLGFLVHPLLSKESPNGVSGNYALLDQIAALKWVNKNIAAFGGNPDCVTIFGQSAGSRSVSLLLISPLASGLFHRAITQSGGPIIGSEYLTPAFNGDMANVSKMGRELAAKLGCDKKKDVLGAMRAIPAEEIIKAADCKTGIFDEALFFAPVFDGWVLPENCQAAFNEGRQNKVPLIVGSVLNEGNNYILNEKNFTLKKYIGFLKSRFGDKYASAFQMFPADNIKDAAIVLDKLITVAVVAEPARFVARSMAKAGLNSYLYQFRRVPGTQMASKAGAFHGVDLAYVFGNMSIRDGYNKTDFELSNKMMDYWVNFAKTGNPNGLGLPEWPVYNADSDINMEFSDGIRVNKNLFKNECDFITEMNQIKDKKKAVKN